MRKTFIPFPSPFLLRLTAAEHKVVTQQLKALAGQLEGVRTLLTASDTGLDVPFQQFRAVEGVAHRAVVQVLDEIVSQKAGLGPRGCAGRRPPGECNYCDRVERLKKEVAGLDLPQVLSYLTEFAPSPQERRILKLVL